MAAQSDKARRDTYIVDIHCLCLNRKKSLFLVIVYCRRFPVFFAELVKGNAERAMHPSVKGKIVLKPQFHPNLIAKAHVVRQLLNHIFFPFCIQELLDGRSFTHAKGTREIARIHLKERSNFRKVFSSFPMRFDISDCLIHGFLFYHIFTFVYR